MSDFSLVTGVAALVAPPVLSVMPADATPRAATVRPEPVHP